MSLTFRKYHISLPLKQKLPSFSRRGGQRPGWLHRHSSQILNSPPAVSLHTCILAYLHTCIPIVPKHDCNRTVEIRQQEKVQQTPNRGDSTVVSNLFEPLKNHPPRQLWSGCLGGLDAKILHFRRFWFWERGRPARTKARRDPIQQRGGASEPDCVFERYWRYHRRPLRPRDFVLSHSSLKGLSNGSPGPSKAKPEVSKPLKPHRPRRGRTDRSTSRAHAEPHASRLKTQFFTTNSTPAAA